MQWMESTVALQVTVAGARRLTPTDMNGEQPPPLCAWERFMEEALCW